jgi:hypothetical protein
MFSVPIVIPAAFAALAASASDVLLQAPRPATAMTGSAVRSVRTILVFMRLVPSIEFMN